MHLQEGDQERQVQVLKAILHLGCQTTLVTDASAAQLEDMTHDLSASVDISLLKVRELSECKQEWYLSLYRVILHNGMSSYKLQTCQATSYKLQTKSLHCVVLFVYMMQHGIIQSRSL